MNIELFKEITTEQALRQLEEAGLKYSGFYADMNNVEERKYVKTSAALIGDLIKKVDRARIDKTKEYKVAVEAEAKSITERLQVANAPFALLIDAHKEKRAAELAAEKAIADAQALVIKIEADHNEAIMIDRIRTIDLAEAEKVRQENEARIKAEAAAEAKIQAELAAQKAIDDAEAARLEAIEREVSAQLRAEQAEERAKQAAEQAEKDRIAEAGQAVIRAQKQAEAAVQAEQARIAFAAKAEAEEQERREKDKRNVGYKRKQAKEALIAIGVDEPMARKIVLAINAGEIPNVMISY